METIIKCSHCGGKNKVVEENIEKNLKCGHCKNIFNGQNGVLELTDSNFSEYIEKFNSVSVVVFYSETCPYCPMAKDAIRDLAKQQGNKIRFAQVNTSHYTQMARKYGVRGVPNSFIIKDNKVVGHISGAVPKNTLMEEIIRVI